MFKSSVLLAALCFALAAADLVWLQPTVGTSIQVGGTITVAWSVNCPNGCFAGTGACASPFVINIYDPTGAVNQNVYTTSPYCPPGGSFQGGHQYVINGPVGNYVIKAFANGSPYGPEFTFGVVATTDIKLYNTGNDNARQVLPSGSIDPHWRYIGYDNALSPEGGCRGQVNGDYWNPPSLFDQPAYVQFVDPGWVPAIPGSAWINGNPSTIGNPGCHYYGYKFNIQGTCISNIHLEFNSAVDDHGYFAVNQINVDYSATYNVPSGWTTIPYSSLKLGQNEIRIVVFNHDVVPNPTGVYFAFRNLIVTQGNCTTCPPNQVLGGDGQCHTVVCGNGIIETGEQCDGGECCRSDCQFYAAHAKACRAAAGPCDLVDYCAADSSVCPPDQFLPKGTQCGEFYGMCNLDLANTCSGTSIECSGPPKIPSLTDQIGWVDFNVISFDSFTCNGGDVQGRLATRNTLTLSGFSLGSELLASEWRNFTLFVGGSGNWADGSMYPDGSQVAQAGPAAFAYVAGSLTGQSTLVSRVVSDPAFGVAQAGAAFDAAKTYYGKVQDTLAALPINAASELKYGDGLFITCTSQTDQLYHLSITAATLSSVNWFSLSGCRFAARWVIDVSGTDDVNFKGSSFPGINERLVWNILGTGRTIFANTGVSGNILAPRNSYSQTQGVTYGMVVVGNVIAARQNNKPNCLNFNSVLVSSKILKTINIGDTQVVVAGVSNFVIGDLVCINSDCKKVTAASDNTDVDGDGSLDHVLTVSEAYSVAYGTANFLTSVVNNPDMAVRDPAKYYPSTAASTSTPITSNEMSGASSIVPLLFLLAAALLA